MADINPSTGAPQPGPRTALGRPHAFIPMQKHGATTLERIHQFTENEIKPLMYKSNTALPLTHWAAPDRVPFSQAAAADYSPLPKVPKFGPLWSTHWFRVETVIPKSWAGREVHLLWDSSSEACVWSADGEPLQGLSGSAGPDPPVRTHYVISREATAGGKVLLYIEIAVNGMFGVHDTRDNSPDNLTGWIRKAELACFDRSVWDMYWDLVVVGDMARSLPRGHPRQGAALSVMNGVVNALNPENRDTWVQPQADLKAFLAVPAEDGAHTISSVGHAHIDTAWLWPIAETRRKVVRTWATATLYAQSYPEYKFAASQAVQYSWVKEMAPDLYKRMQEAAKQGQFLPVGGSWVEMDTNVPSGESLVRQFLLGQRWFEADFGRRCTEFWQPDVFGYSGQLPQIMRQAGIRYFLTQKLSWNQFNKLPTHSFIWEGLDGSQVLAHFPPADTYNHSGKVKDVIAEVANYKDLDRSANSAQLFGWGDGGGGPTVDMIEQLGRMKNTAGLPRVEPRAPEEFFKALEGEAGGFVKWVGELYFEYHRGTYTTQALIKRNNRKTEFLLRNLELFASLSPGAGYPREALTTAWRTLCTNQFHDIIPGTSIHKVFVDSAQEFAGIRAAIEPLDEQAVARASIEVAGADHSASDGAVVFNTLSWPRTVVVDLPSRGLTKVELPAMGYTKVAAPAADAVDVSAAVTVETTASGWTLSNGLTRVEISKVNGEVTSLQDVRPGVGVGEVLAQASSASRGAKFVPGSGPAPTPVVAGIGAAGARLGGNRFVMFDDHPLAWDAWDVDAFHQEKAWDVNNVTSAELVAEGGLRGAVKIAHSLTGASTLVQTISLDAGSRVVKFDTAVQWAEKKRFLKVEFATDVRADHATYEVQYGAIQRPTHMNTSWDMAKFEVCAQRWADLSEPGRGLLIVNDCKYGHSAAENLFRLSLLRGPSDPDKTADQGGHQFSYGIMPHEGSTAVGGHVQQGLEFNVPPVVVPCKAAEQVERVSLFQLEGAASSHIVLDAVKTAEDVDSRLVLRLYESEGRRGSVTVRLGGDLARRFPAGKARVASANLLEEATGDWTPLSSEGTFEVSLNAFELRTVLLE